MARDGTYTGGRKFKKGEGGRKPLPADIKAAINMSREEMCRTVIKVRAYTKLEADSINQNKLTLGERAILNAYIKLDYKGIEYYESRLWGKNKESHEIGFNEDNKIEFTIKRLE